MKQKLFGFLRSDRRGLALISVLGVVSLAMILILALFSVSDAEFKGSNVYADGSTAKHLADNAVNIVIGQIQAAATGTGTANNPTKASPLGATIWASQPGSVRVYDNSGNFILGRALYSSSHMIFPGGNNAEQKMADYAPAADWASNPDQWVDLNAPVTRIKLNSPVQVYFPIFDPRATYTGTLPDGSSYTTPEGFSILERSTGSGLHSVRSSDLGVITATIGGGGSGDLSSWRLPMPVEWLYVLKDGTVGTVLSSGGAAASWLAAGGKPGPTIDNPIIGRVGFWTDDECCKININTAGEPGFWSQPFALHDRERTWADSPPAIFEYQRYPGHPATVALSSVFSPGFDPANYPLTLATSNLTFKNAIYGFVPRLAPGGTQDGTVPFAPDDFTQASTPTLQALENNIMQSKTRPFYASVDEALFSTLSTNTQVGTIRPLNALNRPNGVSVLSPGMLEFSRAFLTAHSRAPETNMFGTPRVAIWPVPDTSSPPGGADWHAYRTGYDSAIATCAKLGSLNPAGTLTETQNSYYFRRLDPASHLTDMGRDPNAAAGQSGLQRNPQLMSYLDNLIHMTMPGGQSFWQKYGNDSEQILVEIFDYIRCTNLYDGFLSSGDGTSAHPGYPDEWRDNTQPLKLDSTADPGLLWEQSPKRNQYFTYTPPRFNVTRKGSDEGLSTAPTTAQAQYNQAPEHPKTGAYPGHGQVKPIEWVPALNPGITFKGFGRFPTISEVALQFICTADGLHDNGSYQVRTPAKTYFSGGKTAERIDTTSFLKRQAFIHKNNYGQLDNQFYYSNIPPFPDGNLFTFWGCRLDHAGKGTPDDPELHPAWDSTQWNCTLDYNPSTKSGVALNEDEKRIQICLLFETFVPAVGYTKYVPDYTLVLKGEQVSGIKVQDATGAWKSVFSTTGPQVVQSTYSFVGDDRGLTAGHDVSPLGGNFAPSAITNGRQVIAVGKMPNDPSYQPQASGNVHAQMLNFPLVSNFLTVKRNDPTDATGKKPGSISFKVEKPLEVDIYASHDWQGIDPGHSVPSQRVNVAFPSGPQSTPVPHLVVYSTEPREYTDSSGNNYKYQAVPCVHWWAFNYGGAINRYQGKGLLTPGSTTIKWNVLNVVENQPSGNMAFTYGRFHSTSYTTVPSKDPFNRGYTGGSSNGVGVTAGGLVYGYSSISTYSGVLADPDQDMVNVDVYFPKGLRDMGQYSFYGTDSVRSIMPRHGDYRMLAARKVVDAGVWDKHPVWQKRPTALFAHSLSGAYSDAVVGFDMGGANDSTIDASNRLVPGAWYESNNGTDGDGKTGRLPVVPDTPLTAAAMETSTRFRDWDNGIGNLRDGAYINKPDDGNLSVMKFYHGHGTADTSGVQAGFYVIRNTYFTSSFLQLPSNSAFFTPNRMMSSPGMFGSLPTGVWGSLATSEHASSTTIAHAASDGVPWRTLLFRADVDGHVGAASWSTGPNKAKGVDPADHYFMDLFFMPVVEPYAITDSYSTAGKINLNYQIVPFTYIRRATALWAAMKGEMITAYSSQDTDPRKAAGLKPSSTNTAIYKKIKDVNPIPPSLWLENGTDNVHWYREIDVTETLTQMDERFNFTASPNATGNVGLMLSPSQVCELHLIPKIPTGTNRPGEPVMTNLVGAGRKQAMAGYWQHNDLTGDNTRERPYANLYQKFTTRSNVFRVFFTAQTIKKARSLAPNQVDTRRDSVTSEYRGSALIERYLDFSSAGALKLSKNDYGAGGPLNNMPSLEDSYHYRVIEMKQFSP